MRKGSRVAFIFAFVAAMALGQGAAVAQVQFDTGYGWQPFGIGTCGGPDLGRLNLRSRSPIVPDDALCQALKAGTAICFDGSPEFQNPPGSTVPNCVLKATAPESCPAGSPRGMRFACKK